MSDEGLPILARGPVEWGDPGASVIDNPDLITVGAVGEQTVAERIREATERPDVYVFHDLDSVVRDGNIDHVVMVGDLMIVIDAKLWRPGKYEWFDKGDGGYCLRDGDLFRPGSLNGVVEAAKDLKFSVGHHGNLEVLVVVCCNAGADALDFTNYDPPHLTVIKDTDLPQVLRNLIDSADTDFDAQRPVNWLTRKVRNREVVAGPFSGGSLGTPRLPGSVPTPDRAGADAKPGIFTYPAAVLVTAGVWGAAAVTGELPTVVLLALWAVAAFAGCLAIVSFAIQHHPITQTVRPLSRFKETFPFDPDSIKPNEEGVVYDRSHFIFFAGSAVGALLLPAALLSLLVGPAKSLLGYPTFNQYVGGPLIVVLSVAAGAVGYWSLRRNATTAIELLDGWRDEWDNMFRTIGELPNWQLPLAAYFLARNPSPTVTAYLNAAEQPENELGWRWFVWAVRASSDPQPSVT